MRKTVIYVLLLLCCLSAAASAAADKKKDLTDFLEQGRELHYRLELGLTLTDLGKSLQELQVKLRQLQDRYPGEEGVATAGKVVRDYLCFQKLWQNRVEISALELREDSGGLTVQSFVRKNYPDFYAEIDPLIKEANSRSGQIPSFIWSGKTAEKVIADDLLRQLSSLKDTIQRY